MKPGFGDPPRWKEPSCDAGALHARAAELVEAAREVPPLAAEALARIRVEVLARGRSSAGRRLNLAFRLALLAIALLASVATARATMTLWRRHQATIVPLPDGELRVSHARPAAHPRPAVVVPVEPVAPPPSPARPIAARPRKVAVVAPVHAPKDAPVRETEAQLLARAIARLRQAHDPAGAVALLDEYATAFPRGMLEAEAANLRLEAALQQHDRPTALRLLDGRSAFAGRLGAQQLLTRAELRASGGRFADALADFDRLLAPSLAPSADGEAALYGRAVCYGRLGRDDRARADLTTYQQRFPGGKHTAEVARLLSGPRPDHRP